MSDVSPPRRFRIISSIALAWNVLGIVAFMSYANLSPEALARMPAAEAALYSGVPVWATAAYAIAVFAGALGCIALLLRKAVAMPLFALSLAGVLVQMGHAYLGANTLDVLGPTSLIMPAVITAISVYLILFSRSARNAGWLA
jgi:hypothetical protein